MNKIAALILAVFILSACQNNSIPVIIQDGGQSISITTTSTIPAEILAKAGVVLGEKDRLLYSGIPVPVDEPLPQAQSYMLTIRRTVPITLVSDQGEVTFQSSALTVGEALTEAGLELQITDRIDPAVDTEIPGPLTIHFKASRKISISVDGKLWQAGSAASTVGEALVDAGLPLTGLDYSIPDESAPVPADGSIRVIRVVETVSLTQKTIPYNTRTELSADLEIDQQALIQNGEVGLATSRLRTRYEEGQQISQKSEGEVIIRPPQDRILGFGTKIVIRTTTVEGVTFEYWRALNLKVTSYSPCEFTPLVNGECMNRTFNGSVVVKGVVAMVRSWFYLFENTSLYIPGYGLGVVKDVGGGWPDGNHYWVDLGWTDEEYIPLTYANGVTVYFLTPVPADPGYILP